jgi:hypothetical protein
MRALGPFPVFRTDQDFAVALAFFTMKFVDRHGFMIREPAQRLKLGTENPSREKFSYETRPSLRGSRQAAGLTDTSHASYAQEESQAQNGERGGFRD